MNLKELSNRVIEWNILARNDIPTELQQEDIVKEELEELYYSIKKGEWINEFKELADVFFTNEYLKHCYPNNTLCNVADNEVTKAINLFGMDVILKVINEVIDSNYTKFIPKIYGEIVAEKEKRILEDQGININIVEKGDYYILLDENNKVRKPYTFYKEPNIEQFV